jgi:hypothetical protein
MRYLLSLVLLAVLLSACAGSPRWVWKHHEYGDERTREDLEICGRQAFQGVPGMPLMVPDLAADFYEERQDLIRDCMEEQGYYHEAVKRPRN